MTPLERITFGVLDAIRRPVSVTFAVSGFLGAILTAVGVLPPFGEHWSVKILTVIVWLQVSREGYSDLRTDLEDAAEEQAPETSASD